MLLGGGRAAAEDLADVLVGLALDHPVKHFGLARRQLQAQAHCLDDGGVGHLAQDDHPLGAVVVVAGLLMQPQREAARRRADRQYRRLDAIDRAREVLAQPAEHDRRRLGRAGAAIAQQQLARQSGLPDEAAFGQAHGDAGVAECIERVARLAGLLRRLPRAACALQMHVHARQHFLRLDRLGDVVDAACLQRGNKVLGLGEAGHEDDRDVRSGWVGLKPARDLEAVDAGHHGVEQHDVGARLCGALQRGFSVGRDQHGVAGFVERVVQHCEVVGHVVDDQHQVGVAGQEAVGGVRAQLQSIASNRN